MQDVPDAGKQAEWDGPKPDKFDWDAEIERVVEEGKEVPEVEWAKPGEDAAWEVSPRYPHSRDMLLLWTDMEV